MAGKRTPLSHYTRETRRGFIKVSKSLNSAQLHYFLNVQPIRNSHSLVFLSYEPSMYACLMQVSIKDGFSVVVGKYSSVHLLHSCIVGGLGRSAVMHPHSVEQTPCLEVAGFVHSFPAIFLQSHSG